MRASAFRSTCQAACYLPRAVRPAQLGRTARQQLQRQQRGYASGQQQSEPPRENRQMDTPNKSGNLPLLIGAGSLLIGGAMYFISAGQGGVKHNDHAAQAGGEFTQGRGQRGSSAAAAAGGPDASRTDLPLDAPNRPENLAASEQKMQSKAPSKRTNPLA